MRTTAKWTAFYPGNVLPNFDPIYPWGLVSVGNVNTLAIEEGRLHISTQAGGTRRYDRNFASLNGPLALPGMTILFRPQIVSVGNGFKIDVIDNLANVQSWLFLTDRYQVDGAVARLLDTTVPRTYRLTYKAGTSSTTFAVYEDESATAAQTGTATNSVQDSTEIRMFWQASTDAYVDYLYYSLDGAFAPDDPELPTPSACLDDDFSLRPFIKPCIIPARIPAIF